MLKLTLLLLLATCLHAHQCIHDQFVKNTTIHFYNDLSEHRMLQAPVIGPLRTYFDYSQIVIGAQRDRIMIKQSMEIAATFFHNTLTVPRLQKLYYPNDVPLKCNVLDIPAKYITQGLDADVAVVVGSENVPTAPQVAKSTACAYLKSNNRPIWGMISFNIPNFQGKYSQPGFQQIVAISVHQFTHILVFSSISYDLYPSGTPVVGNLKTFEDLKISTPRINFEISKHFGCSNSIGLDLEDQDGTLIASHWEKHHMGSEFMIASVIKNTYVSPMTLALFEYSGWYTNVSYQYSESTGWGKGKGCPFLNINDCDFDEFCNTQYSFGCTNSYKQIGRCLSDSMTGSCLIYKYYSNTICNDENYELLNYNAHLQAGERGGYNSQCIESNLRKTGLNANIINSRCYVAVCWNGNVYLLIQGQNVIPCTQAGPANQTYIPAGLEGYIECPNPQDMCQEKPNCPYNCNKNGMCINGQCLCTGSTALSVTCNPPDYTNDQFGQSGGRLLFEVSEEGVVDKPRRSLRQVEEIMECPTGFIFDPTQKKCQSCEQLLGCRNCNMNGCVDEQ